MLLIPCCVLLQAARYDEIRYKPVISDWWLTVEVDYSCIMRGMFLCKHVLYSHTALITDQVANNEALHE